MLSLENINVAIEGVPVLRNVGFSLKAGESAALIGRNGAGKTTTVRTIMGFTESGGTVRYPISTAFRNSSSSIAAATVKSRVGRSSSIGTTRRSAPANRAIWLTAAPPREKFATICSVTACG